MPDFLFRMQDHALFLLLSGTFIAASLIIVTLLRNIIPHEVRFRENAIIGSVSALVSLIYGVLAGLIALYLINTNTYTEDAVQREANAAADVYRESGWLKSPVRETVRGEVKAYLEHAISSDWKAMTAGQLPDQQGDMLIDKISADLSGYAIQTPSEVSVMPDLVLGVKQLYDARQLRIHASTLDLGPEIWLVIIIGTLLTVGINWLYGMNFYIHLITVAAAALMVASMVFLLITTDKPFQGEFVVGPDALQAVLDRVGGK